MKKKEYIEAIIISVFVLFGILALFKVPYSAMVFVIAGGLAAMLYWPLSLWLFIESGSSILFRIVLGVAYATGVVAVMFGLLNWTNWRFECIVAYGALILAAIFSVQKKAYRPYLWRCVFFALVITLLYVYRGF